MATRLLDRSSECTYRCTYEVRRPDERTSVSRREWHINRGRFLRIVKSCASMTVLAPERSVPLERFTFGGRTEPLRILVIVAVLKVKEKFLVTSSLDRLLYSIADAAILLSCSKNTVYSLMRSGEIVAVYPTSKARISRAALERFVEKKEAESRTERQAQRSMTR